MDVILTAYIVYVTHSQVAKASRASFTVAGLFTKTTAISIKFIYKYIKMGSAIAVNDFIET